MGARKSAGVQKLSSREPTAFENRLFKACRCIPRGKVATYGMLAKLLGSSPRAVGQGMRRNPYAPMVPCHRVVASDNRLGGFCGAWGDDSSEVIRKRRLLSDEGVLFLESKVENHSVVALSELETLYKVAGEFNPLVLGTTAP